MSNVRLCYPNRAAGAAYSGQGWVPTLPLSHLTTRQLSQVARSHPTPMATLFATFGAATDVGVAALAGHNLSTSGQWRLRGYSADPRPYVDRSAQVATLDLRFADGPLPAGIACTRASVATYFDAAGVLQTAAADTARITHDPVTGACLGLLAEPAATNVLQWCRDLSNAYWTKTNMTAALTATGIDGAASSATRLTATAGNATVTRASITSGRFSLFARRVSGSGTVEISSNTGGGWTAITLTSTWQRFDIGGTAASTHGIRIVTSGDVIEVDFLQAEGTGGAPTTPIYTTGGSGVRQADSITYTPSYTLSLSAGTLVVQARYLATLSGAAAQWLRLRDAADTSAVRLTSDTSRNVVAEYINAGATQCSLTTGGTAPAVGALFGVAASWAANDYRASRSGAAAVTDGAGTVSSNAVSTILITPPTNLPFSLARLTVLPAASTSAEAQDLSTADPAPGAGYDSGWLDAWPAEWVATTAAEQRSGARGLALHTPASTQSWRYWRIDLRDTARTYVELGRAFLGGAWAPEVGLVVGASLGYEDRASVVETDSGAEYVVERPNPRVLRGTLEALSQEEAFGQVLELQRQLGTTGELLVMLLPADRANQPRHHFLARFRSLAPAAAVGWRRWSAPVEIKELL